MRARGPHVTPNQTFAAPGDFTQSLHRGKRGSSAGGTGDRRPSRITTVLAVRIAILIGSNMVALMVVDWMFDGVSIRRWWPLIIGAAVLGFANAILKPILAILTLPLIVVTLGLAYFAINVAMLALAEWIAPDFSIDGFWTYVGATVVVWLVNVAIGLLLDAITGEGGKSKVLTSYR
jgi:putative membrane protein